MFYQTANASFKTSFTLDKNVAGLSEIYFNEALNYPDGYKLSVTDKDGGFVPLTTHTDLKNYISLDMVDAEPGTINVILTPEMPASGMASGTEAANGYSVDWNVQDTGKSSECTFQVDFGPTPTASNNFADYLVKLVDSTGNQVAKITNDQTINTSCYDMAGGSVQIL